MFRLEHYRTNHKHEVDTLKFTTFNKKDNDMDKIILKHRENKIKKFISDHNDINYGESSLFLPSTITLLKHLLFAYLVLCKVFDVAADGKNSSSIKLALKNPTIYSDTIDGY